MGRHAALVNRNSMSVLYVALDTNATGAIHAAGEAGDDEKSTEKRVILRATTVQVASEGMRNRGSAKTGFTVTGRSMLNALSGMRVGQAKLVDGRVIHKVSDGHFAIGGKVYRRVTHGTTVHLEPTSVRFHGDRRAHGNHVSGDVSTTKLVAAARRAGKEYLLNQIQDTHFSDWIIEQIHQAESNPEDHWLVNTKADAKKFAKNALQQLGWDFSRDMGMNEILSEAGAGHMTDEPTEVKREIVGAFMEGFNKARESASTISFVADEALLRVEEFRENKKSRRA